MATIERPAPAPSWLAQHFRFAERSTSLRTELLAGLTTFVVMAYIIFVNPVVLAADGKGPGFAATLTVTCLTAGLLSIAMGLYANYPFALAPGMGLNAIVAAQLPRNEYTRHLLISHNSDKLYRFLQQNLPALLASPEWQRIRKRYRLAGNGLE